MAAGLKSGLVVKLAKSQLGMQRDIFQQFTMTREQTHRNSTNNSERQKSATKEQPINIAIRLLRSIFTI